MEETKKLKLYQKWWFWVIILAIVIIGAISIMAMTFNSKKSEISDLAIQIQEIHKDAIVYSSKENKTLFIELRNWSNKNSNELGKIIDIVKNTGKNKLSMYDKFVTLAYLESNDKKESLIVKNTYSLPDFIQDKENSNSYILFDEYQELFDTYSNAMKLIGIGY